VRAIRFLVGLAVALAVTGVEAAEGPKAPAGGYTIDTVTTAGYRLVDVDGAEQKYREDYNLRSGFRLFTLDVDGQSKAPETTRLDRFHLDVDTPGDEPVSHFRLSAADRTLYDFRANFTRSKYFYEVPYLFEAPVAGDVRLDDLHDWNFVRTNGSVDLRLHPHGLPTLFFGYRLYERHGDAKSTVRIRAGDTFVVPAPVDSTTHVGRLGTEFTALDTNVFLQQEYRHVARGHDLGPAGARPGVDPTDASTLAFFQNDQEEHLDIPATTVRLRRPLGERAELTGAYFYSHADLGFDVARRSAGTVGVDGSPVATSSAARGSGDATLDTHVADTGASLRLGEHIRLETNYRLNDQSQSGALDEQSTFGPIAAVTGDHVRTHSVTSDVAVEPRADLSLRAGARYARRDARFSQSGQNIATDTVGAIGSADYRPWTFLGLFARYENVQIDDPFTVPGDASRTPALPERQIALTFTNRGTAGVRVEPWDWLAASYQLVTDSRENDTFGARSRSFGNSVALTVTPLQDLTLFASYTRRDLDSQADIYLAPVYSRALSLQNGSEDVFVTELRWDFGLGGQRWSTGWDVAYVNADTTLRPNFEPGLAGRMLFDLDRIDGGAFLALHHRLIEPSIEFRMIDYNERALPGNDYRATILAFKLTKRWSF
jgi:hypothetical protein